MENSIEIDSSNGEKKEFYSKGASEKKE